MNTELRRAVLTLIDENHDVKRAFDSLTKRGLSDRFAEAEIGRALLLCLLEANWEMPNRFASILDEVVDGQSEFERRRVVLQEAGGALD